MSLISEQTDQLRKRAEECGLYKFWGVKKDLEETADTIEVLSANLASENMDRSSVYYNGG